MLATLIAVGIVSLLFLGILALVNLHPPPNAAPSTSQLVYNGGPVMHTAQTYAIFWLPTGRHFEIQGSDARYEAIVEGFLRDVGGTRYYDLLTQYSQSAGSPVADGPIVDRSRLDGIYVDRRPYPHTGTQSDPLQDTDLSAEVKRVMRINHWRGGMDHLFLVFLGASVNVCSPDGTCTFDTGSGHRDCGYHTSDQVGGRPLLLAALPDSFSLSYAGTCIPLDPDHSPHQDAVADSEVVILSHELFETVTDPLITSPAWYDGDPNGGEIGDKCTRLRGVVRLHGHRYVVQDQWSNVDGGCVLSHA